MKNFTLRWKNFVLELGRRTAVMGIVNVTPDSFSDGGRYYSAEAALAQAEDMVLAGADIIDIGGESTRPFAPGVSAEDEKRRVLPIIEKLASRISIPISIDTAKASVAEAALCAGASIINDISALCMDDLMGEVAARHKVPVILMHMKGTPRTMQVDPVYDDLMAEIIYFLRNAIARAHNCGIEKQNIIVDPGIGFGKTGLHNLQIIRNLHLLETLQAPILIGPSRKAFIRKLLTGPDQKEPRPDSPQVEIGTQAAVAASVMNGAHIVRVHNVTNTRAVVDVLDAIRGASLRVK